MNDAGAYNENSSLQIQHAREFVPYLVSKMKIRSGENVLDFGSGSGYVTKHVLLPALENAHTDSNRKIYGVDISRNMTEFASNNYAHPQITYTTLDIQKDKAEFPCKFDKVFSFLVLHWVSDQADFLEKVNLLMNRGGQISCYFAIKSPIFFVYDILRNDPNWAHYLEDAEKFIPKSIYSSCPAEDFSGFMRRAGFVVYECSVLPREYICSDVDEMMKIWMAVDPFIGRIPSSLQELYKARFLQELAPFYEKVPSNKNKNGLGVRIYHEVMLVRGNKL